MMSGPKIPVCSWSPLWLWYQYVPLCLIGNLYSNVYPAGVPS